MTEITAVNRWMKKSMENLIPLSSKSDFQAACAELCFSGEVIDHFLASSKCELCEQERLRFHFKIYNAETKNEMWVGSLCILRFQDIVIYDENENLLSDYKQRKKALDEALKRHQIEMRLSPLRALWRVNHSDRKLIEGVAYKIKSGSAPSPRELRDVFILMRNNQVEFTPNIYLVDLKSSLYQYELLSMTEEEQRLLLPTMSKNQKNRIHERE